VTLDLSAKVSQAENQSCAQTDRIHHRGGATFALIQFCIDLKRQLQTFRLITDELLFVCLCQVELETNEDLEVLSKF
jgi:hypothetical protein